MLTVCDCGMSPGHPFARESEYSVAVLEFGCHCDQRKILHPNERSPKHPEGGGENREKDLAKDGGI